MSTVRSLLIAPIYAASCLTGGGQRTFHIYRALALLGTVDVVFISEPTFWGLEAGFDAIREQFPDAGSVVVQRSTSQFLAAPPAHAGCVKRLAYDARRAYHALRSRAHVYRPNDDALEALIRSIELNRYDVLVGRYLQTTALSGAFEQRLVPVVVDLDDLDEIVLQSRIASRTTAAGRRLVLRYRAWQVGRVARRLRTRCQHVFTASEVDRLFVAHPSSSVLPNIPFYQSDRGWPVTTPSTFAGVVLFVGSYGHRINREGLLHFIVHCWPAIRERTPRARLRVVGSGGWENEREQLEKTAGVEVVGAVADLANEYASAAFCIVPLFEGSGTKIKVLEALMYGRAVVATSHSAHGYEKLIGHGVAAVSDDASMIGECVELLKNPSRCCAMADAGLKAVKAQYSFDAVSESVSQGLVAAKIIMR